MVTIDDKISLFMFNIIIIFIIVCNYNTATFKRTTEVLLGKYITIIFYYKIHSRELFIRSVYCFLT